MKKTIAALTVVLAFVGLSAESCDTKTDNTTRVTKKDGAVNPALCSGDTPFIIRTRTGKEGEKIHCVTEEDFAKYDINAVFP